MAKTRNLTKLETQMNINRATKAVTTAFQTPANTQKGKKLIYLGPMNA